MYADLEDDCASEKTRLELLNDFLEELAVQEGWLDVAEKTYPAEKSGKAKDAEVRLPVNNSLVLVAFADAVHRIFYFLLQPTASDEDH